MGLNSLFAGQTLRSVDRRGKYLLLRFDVGSILVHLGMSGSLSVVRDLKPLVNTTTWISNLGMAWC